MMGAAQPFLSGAICKTVNMPKDATVEDIQQAYIDSWRLGAKAVSIYRDGCKRTQPLNTSKDKAIMAAGVPRRRPGGRRSAPAQAAGRAPRDHPQVRHRRPRGLHHRRPVRGRQPGEIFLVMAKEGSTISGFADAFAQAISYALQYGVPLQDLVDKFSHVRFEPSGMTKNPDIRFAKSIVDYIFRWMAAKFLSPEAQFRAGVNNREEVRRRRRSSWRSTSRRPPAPRRRSRRRRRRRSRRCRTRKTRRRARPAARSWCAAGACYKCSNCGTTSGCA